CSRRHSGQRRLPRRCPVFDANGEKIGKLDRVYFDEQTRVPEWVGIDSGFLGMKHLLAPVTGATRFEDGLQVCYSKDQVKESPSIGEDEIDIERERELYQYYGLPFSQQRSGSQLPAGQPKGQTTTGQTTGGQSMTRYDEEHEHGSSS